MDIITKIIFYAWVVFSAIVHEVSHGLTAEHFGDDTARRLGRITFNPIPHIDLFYTIIMPLLFVVSGSGIVMGGAKPVPVNFSRLKDPRKHGLLVSLAGPFSNLALAVLCVLPITLHLLPPIGQYVFAIGVLANLGLFAFNILPIPPLDGSKIIFYLLPVKYWGRWFQLESFGYIFLIIFLYTPIFTYIYVFVFGVFGLIFRTNVFSFIGG